MARTDQTGPGRRWVLPAVVVLLWLFVGGPLGSFAGRLAEVQKNDNASFLPQSAESTKVLDEFLKFTGQQSLPTTVVFEREDGLTAADKTAIAGYTRALAEVDHVDAQQVGAATYSSDGTAAWISSPSDDTTGTTTCAAVPSVEYVAAPTCCASTWSTSASDRV